MGNVIGSKIRLLNQFGAIELALNPNFLSLNNRGPEDWKYVQLNPDLGIVFHSFNLQDYGSRDLDIRHPQETKADYRSRRAKAGDIIVLQNGENINLIPMEQYIVANNPDISAVPALVLSGSRPPCRVEPVANGQELIYARRNSG